MYSYMEYLQKCFNKTTGWNEDNIYSNILATSNALLNFSIPNGGRLDVSSQATSYSASSISLSNHQSVNGSLAYLYSSVGLSFVSGTKDVSLQDAIAGFRVIEPHEAFSSDSNATTANFKKASLLYGRMYFPGSALEAMVVKRLSSRYRILVKCISSPHMSRHGTLILYFQENAPRFSREFIYSTKEALMGFRCLYNFGSLSKAHSATVPKFDNSVISVGAEVWYAAMTMSPGLSTAIRYSTRSTSTGKPLTMTLSCNPILGHISSTYNVKTSVSSTVCSKYDFNWFSYASNLSIGIELFNFRRMNPFSRPQTIQDTSAHHNVTASSPQPDTGSMMAVNKKKTPLLNLDLQKRSTYPIDRTNGHFLINSRSFENFAAFDLAGQEVISGFQKMVKGSDFSSVIKGSTSLSDRMAKILWVGRYKDFLVSTGVKLKLNTVSLAPEFDRIGITFAYAC